MNMNWRVLFIAVMATVAASVDTPAAAQEQALPLTLDALVARTDSVIIRMNGNAVGWQRFTTVRKDHGFLLTEETVTPAGGQQTEIDLDDRGNVVHVRQEGRGSSAGVFTHITYSDRKVHGRHGVLKPGSSTIDTVTIDHAVPVGVVDDNSLQQLMSALPWSADASWTFPYYSSGKQSVASRTLRVTGSEIVTVPAGTFDTWRAEMDAGDNSIVTFNVSRSEPHRVVQVRLSGAPFDFALANWR